MDKSERLEIFEKVRRQYGGLLTGVLWKLAGERELFAEAMQIALLKMWQNVEKLETPAAGAYIYRIALSANSTAWKKRISRDGQESFEQSGQEPEAPAASYEARAGVDDELVEQVRRAIARLPVKQGQAIVMRYLEQREYDAIAERIGCSEVGARSNVSKALAVLRKKLSGLVEGDV